MVSEYVRRPAGPRVAPFAASYSGYRQRGVAPMRHRGLPSPFLTLIVTLDEPLHVEAHPDPRTPPGRYEALLGGLHTVPAMITHDGNQSGIQIAVSPLGARTLFGLPAGELAGLDVAAADVLGSFATELQDRVRCAGTWPARFAVVDAMLAARAAAGPLPGPSLPAPEVVHAWRRVLATGGAVSTAALAREVGWSSRYLSRRFNVEIGLSPKAAARVTRFDVARRRLLAGGVTLAGLAADCGYYDQAHLTREFNDFAGCPPARWLAEEGVFTDPAFRNVQALAVPHLADSVA